MAPLIRRIAWVAMASATVATAAAANVSDGRACEVDATTSNELRDQFFDASCLLALDATVPCPLDEADAFIREFSGELRFEGLMQNVAMLLLCVSLAQVGGIPLPKDIVGKTCWGMWFGLVLFQWLTVQCSLALLVGAYWSATQVLGPCMVPWDVGGGAPFLHAANLPYFAFQPRVFFLLATGALYTWMAVFALHVLNQSHDVLFDESAQWALPCCWPPLPTLSSWQRVVLLAVGQSTSLFMVLPTPVMLVLCILAWLLTASIVFGLVFFLPVALTAAAGTCISIVLIRITRRYIFQPIWSFALGMLPSCIPVPDGVKDTALMFWWMQFEYADEEKISGLFQAFMFLVLFLAALGPCVCYGSTLAWYVYGGRSIENHFELLFLLYRHHFGVFFDTEFEVASLADVWRFIRDCDLDCYEEWTVTAFGFLAGFGRCLDLGPVHFLEGSIVLMALNFLLNLVKPFVPFINVAIVLTHRPSDNAKQRNITVFEICSLRVADEMHPHTIKEQAKEMRESVGASPIDKE